MLLLLSVDGLGSRVLSGQLHLTPKRGNLPDLIVKKTDN